MNVEKILSFDYETREHVANELISFLLESDNEDKEGERDLLREIQDGLFGLDNLDDMTVDNLREYIKQRQKSIKVQQHLRDYAILKQAAIQFREKGSVQTAIDLERQCQNIYENLPQWARW